MNNLDFKEFAKNIAEYVGVEDEKVTRDSDLYTDFLIDSLGLFSMGIYLKGIYHLEVSLSSVAVINKVGDLFDLINEKGVAISEKN